MQPQVQPINLEEAVSNLELAANLSGLPGDLILQSTATLARGAVEQEVSAGRCTREEAQAYLARIREAAPAAKHDGALFGPNDIDHMIESLRSLKDRDDRNDDEIRMVTGAMVMAVVNRALIGKEMGAEQAEEIRWLVRSLLPGDHQNAPAGKE